MNNGLWVKDLRGTERTDKCIFRYEENNTDKILITTKALLMKRKIGSH